MKELVNKLFGVLNGRKTAIGLILVVLGSILEKFEPASGAAIQDIGWGLTGLGALHKTIKGS